MGSSDVALEHKLMDTYLRLLAENETLPSAICFYTDGVRLVSQDSPMIERLQEIEQKGVRLIACSTWLNHLGLEDKVKVGIVGGMSDILEAQVKAAKVISI
jgi:intracellular sulfur oxidation DsrE/DsrF family protein